MKWLLTVMIMVLISCTERQNMYTGDWSVQSKYYDAVCRIELRNGQLRGWYTTYDDGTTRYSSDGDEKRYLFQNLEAKDNAYVDGVSGASKKADQHNDSFKLELLGKDTLISTTTIMGKPLKETWIRI